MCYKIVDNDDNISNFNYLNNDDSSAISEGWGIVGSELAEEGRRT
jgi:hypothetical protein